MKPLINIIFSVFIIITAHAQEISRHEADSLLRSLRKNQPVASRTNLLLRLAVFNILKPGEYKIDLDSAAAFIKQAVDLNVKSKQQIDDGYKTLVESYLARERGQTQVGKELNERAIKLLNNSKEIIYIGDAYLGLAQYYDTNDSLQLLEKINLLEKASSAFEQTKNIAQYANTQGSLGEIYFREENTSNALVKLNLALTAYKSINYTDIQDIYIMLGDIYKLKADYQQALNYQFLALKTAESRKDTSDQLCKIYNRIGIIYLTMDEKEQSIHYFKAALDIAENLNNNDLVLNLVHNLTSVYNKQSPEKGLAFLKSVPEKYLVTNKRGLDFVIPLAYLSAYISLNQYSEGKPYTEQIIKLIDRYQSDKGTLSNFYKILSNYYVGTKEFTLARTYLTKNYELLLTMNDPYRMSLNYRWLFKLDSAEGNYKSAMVNLLAYNKLHDSIYNETKSRQIKEIGVQYETEKKDNELKLKDNDIRLNKQDILLLTRQSELQQMNFDQTRLRFQYDSSSKEQSLQLLNSEAVRKDKDIRLKQQDISLLKSESLLQQAKLKETKITKNFIIVAAAMLLFLLALGYNRYRIKQRANKLINDKNLALQQFLHEKEWLLKEVHHRVKNNLHTVICLLESQAAYLENDALKANENTQHRIYAMSLIHQKLYKSEDIKTIDMSIYLPEFVDYLRDGFGIQQQIHFDLDIEPIKLGVSQAIPLALILNEAITNSIKYAFPLNKKGAIVVAMHKSDKNIEVVIADNGIGIDPLLADTVLNSLGLQLMKGLSEDIEGQIVFQNKNGTKITITFNVDPLDVNEQILNTPFKMEAYA